jgi:hypothetical protein
LPLSGTLLVAARCSRERAEAQEPQYNHPALGTLCSD